MLLRFLLCGSVLLFGIGCSGATNVVGAGGVGGGGGSASSSNASTTASSGSSSSGGDLSMKGAHSAQVGGVDYDESMTIALDPEGHVVIAGSSKSPIDFGEGPVGPIGTTDLFVAGLADDGSFSFAKRFGAFYANPVALAIEPDGSLLVTGTFSGALDFGAVKLEGPDPGEAAFIAKLTKDGYAVWAHAEVGPGHLVFGGPLGWDSSGAIFTVVQPLDAPALLKLGPDGTPVFSKPIGTFSSVWSDFGPVEGLTVDGHGDVFLAGVEGTVNFGMKVLGADGDPIVVEVRDDNALSVVATKLASSTGDALWSRTLVKSGWVTGAARDADGRIAIVASANEPPEVGGDRPVGTYLIRLDATTGDIVDTTPLPEVGSIIAKTENGFWGIGSMAIGKGGRLALETSFFGTATTSLASYESRGWGDVLAVWYDR